MLSCELLRAGGFNGPDPLSPSRYPDLTGGYSGCIPNICICPDKGRPGRPSEITQIIYPFRGAWDQPEVSVILGPSYH